MSPRQSTSTLALFAGLFLVFVQSTMSWSKYDFGYSECTYNTYHTNCIGTDGYQLHEKGMGLTQFPPLKRRENCLVLENNEIQEFPRDLSNYATLLTLNVAKNKIKSLPDDLDTLSKLQILDLSANSLSGLSASTRFPHSLEALILKGNTIQSLPTGLEIPGLFVFDLSENRFTNIPKEFCVSKQLIRVDFTQNKLGDISQYVDVLDECRNVNEISFCMFTDSDYIQCDCNTLGPMMLRKPAFQIGTPLPNQLVTCGATSVLSNMTGTQLYDVHIDDVSKACPLEREKGGSLTNDDHNSAQGNISDKGTICMLITLVVSLILLR